jgi:hypothetical protein
MPPLETPLTSVQELVERSVFHSIRAQCVAKGYTPNVFDYASTPAGQMDYDNAFAVINSEKGFSIEVFNTGAPSDRKLKKLPRIVLATQGYIPGAIGGDQAHQYQLGANEKYARVFMPPTTSDLYLNIHVVSSNIQQHRILSAIIALAVPRMGYSKLWNSTDNEFVDEYFFTNHLSYVPVRQYNAPGTMETIHRYVIPDLFEVLERKVSDYIISPLLAIDLGIGEVGYNLVTSKALPEVPEGYAYLTDTQGRFIIDHQGEFIIVPEENP